MKKIITLLTTCLLFSACTTNPQDKEKDKETKTTQYSVDFNYDGYSKIYVESGSKITKPEDPEVPTEEGKNVVFDGWYYGTRKWDFENDVVTSDTVLTARFRYITIKYTVNFVVDGQVVQTSQVEYGTRPFYRGNTPTKPDEGDYIYIFKGWDHEIDKVYSDETYIAVFDKVKRDLYFEDLKEYYHSYLDEIESYLLNENADISNYAESGQYENQPQPIQIKVRCDFANATNFKFYYSLNDDFTDAKCIELKSNSETVSLYNLYKASTYYIKLTAEVDGQTKVKTDSFKTTDLGPRVMKIDGIYNTRDLGGYMTSSGKRTKQGVIFRGGSLSKCTDTYYDRWVTLTEAGNDYMSNELKIKTDMDLRTIDENLGLSESKISSAELKYYGISGYLGAFTQKSLYKNVFKDLANPATYPAYIHCTGGADRTGTVSFLLNALCGVSEKDLIHDYEFTSFSIYGVRNSKEGAEYDFYEFLQALKNDYSGSTLAEKTNNYLLDIGLTQAEIDNIKHIMFGEKLPNSIIVPSNITLRTSNTAKITLVNDDNVSKVLFNTTEVAFTKNGSTITISKDALKNLESGNYVVKVILDDGTELTSNTTLNTDLPVTIDDLFDFNEDKECIITSLTKGKQPVGYGKTFQINMKTNCGQNGGVYAFIGSYGFYLRGGELRIATLTSSNSCKEKARELGMSVPNSCFNSGDKTLFLKIDVTSSSVTMKVEIYTQNVLNYSYQYTNNSWKLVSEEIPDNEATVSFAFVNGVNDGGTSLTLYKSA